MQTLSDSSDLPLACGSFATYSSDLRERLSLDQRGLEFLAVCKDMGAYVGVAAGFFHDAYGPRRTVLAGAVLHCVGYYSLFMLCGMSQRRIPVWQPALLLGMAANGAGFIDMGCLMTLLHNAGSERSLMAGVAKSLLGLCGSVFTAIYIAFIKPDARDFLLLLAVTPLIVGALTHGRCAPVPFADRLVPRAHSFAGVPIHRASPAGGLALGPPQPYARCKVMDARRVGVLLVRVPVPLQRVPAVAPG